MFSRSRRDRFSGVVVRGRFESAFGASGAKAVRRTVPSRERSAVCTAWCIRAESNKRLPCAPIATASSSVRRGNADDGSDCASGRRAGAVGNRPNE